MHIIQSKFCPCNSIGKKGWRSEEKGKKEHQAVERHQNTSNKVTKEEREK
jgi:hypothetical protein